MPNVKNALLVILLVLPILFSYGQPTTWDSSTTYSVGDLVVSGESTYIATASSSNQEPPDTSYWTDLSDAASALGIPAEDVPSLDTTTILDSLSELDAPDTDSSNVSFTENDILIENSKTGERAAWNIYGTYRQFLTEENILTGGSSIGTFDSSTKLVASGDFDGDGNVDLVTTNTSTGAVNVVFLNNSNVTNTISLISSSTNLSIVGAADFNSDGKLDLFSEDVSSGAKTIHFITGSGTSISISNTTVLTSDTSYRIAGVADFNADGKPDLIAEQVTNSSDPLFKTNRQIWYTDGTAVTSKVTFLDFDQEWTIINAGDFDLDGTPDLMVEQFTTGRKGIWYMTSNSIREGFEYVTLQEKWKSRCTGDINKDGNNDALFQDTVSGSIIVLYLGNQDGSLNQWGHKYTYQAVNRNFISAGNPSASTDWKMRGFIDHDNDGKTSILSENTNSGDCAIWSVDSESNLGSLVFKNKGSNIKLIGSGQFGGDSTPDIVIENTTTGEKKIWIMSYSAGSFTISSEVLVTTDAIFSIVGIGDFNSDSNLDLVVEELTASNSPLTNIARKIWFMNGTSKVSEETFLTFVQEWRIKGTKDFDSNGTPDLIVEQENVGRRGVWYMTGSKLTEGFIFGTVDPSWVFPHQ